MKNINIGIANLIISNKLKESHFNNNLIEESRKITSDFLEIVKNSPILQLEFKVFSGIENKHIDNEILIKEYVDNNIELFEIYTIEEIEAERAKLKLFIGEGVPPLYKKNEIKRLNLYGAIDTLIIESLKYGNEVDVDGIHESFTLIFNHIKTPKKALIENVNVEPINEEVIEIAVGKFNEKYAELNENDKELLKKLIKSSDAEKETLLETLKTENLTILESISNESAKANIEKAVKKINEMVYNKENVDDNIIELNELKKELI